MLLTLTMCHLLNSTTGKGDGATPCTQKLRCIADGHVLGNQLVPTVRPNSYYLWFSGVRQILLRLILTRRMGGTIFKCCGSRASNGSKNVDSNFHGGGKWLLFEQLYD